MSNNKYESEEPVTFDAVMRACGSSSHHPEEELTPIEILDVLSEVHPVTVGEFVQKWADAVDQHGGSGPEHPHFRQQIQSVLDSTSEQ